MILCDSTFRLIAAKAYDNPNCHDIEEFEEDLKRFMYVRKLMNRYKAGGDLKERLILNHLVIVYNCFGRSATDLLFFRLQGFHHILVPFLSYLNLLPRHVKYENIILDTSTIPCDESIVTLLRMTYD